MATVVLSLAGAAIAGSGTVAGTSIAVASVGATIGGVVGGVLDSFVLSNVFGPNETSFIGPSIDDLRIQTASEGSPIRQCFGSSVRTAGVVLWMGPLQETVSTSGGKGGGPTVQNRSFAVSALIGLCGLIEEVERVWADGRLIYAANPDPLQAGPSTLIGASPVSQTNWMNIQSLVGLGGPNFTELGFKSGQQVVVTGFSNSNNNGTFTVRKVTTDATFSTLQVINPQFAVAETIGASVTVTHTPASFDPADLADISFLLGTDSQDPPALIESFEGPDEVPGFRHVSGVLIEDLQLAKSGNRLPQFNVQLRENSSRTVGETIAMLLEEAGFSADEYDVSDCDQPLNGYVISQTISSAQKIDPLLLAYDLIVQEVDGVQTFAKRTSAQLIEVDSGLLAAHEPSTDTPRDLSLNKISEDRIPTQVVVKYIDPEIDYQKGSQSQRVQTSVPFEVVETLDLPLVFSAQEARAIARRRLWQGRGEDTIVELFLPPSMLYLTSGDVISVTTEGHTRRIRLIEVSVGANLLIQARGRVEAIEAATATGVAEEGFTFDQSINPNQVLTFELLDVAPLSDLHTNVAGFYWVVASLDPNASFSQAALYQSSDNINFNQIGQEQNEAVMGTANSALPHATHTLWDRVNTVSVTLDHGTLESVTESQVLAGANRALLGEEFIAFTTATNTSGNTWELSGLLRGRRNTFDKTGSHVVGERFVLLEEATVNFRQISLGDIGLLKYFKAIPNGGNLENAESKSLTFVGNTLAPFAPANVHGTHNSNGSRTIKWSLVTRSIFRILSTTTAPMLDETDEWEVDILDAPGGSVLRTLHVSDARSVTYLGVQLLEDGFTSADSIPVRVHQVSPIVGRGKGREGLIP